MDAHTASLAETTSRFTTTTFSDIQTSLENKKRTLNSIKMNRRLDYSGYQAKSQEAKGPTERAIGSPTNQTEYRPPHRRTD